MPTYLPGICHLLLCLALVLAPFAATCRAQQPSGKAAFGRIHYPAQEIVNLGKGSFEMIVTLHFDPARKHYVPYTSPMTFFSLRDFPEEGKPRQLIHLRSMATYRQQRDEGELLTSILGEGDARTALALGGELIRKSLRIPADRHQLRKGETVHLAFTWQYERGAYTSAVYINGVEYGRQQGGGTPPFTYAGNPEVWIGSPHFTSAYGTVHAMRFSSEPRTEEEFRQSAAALRFESDEATLYIEDFPSLDSGSSGPQSLGKGGSLDGFYRILSPTDGRPGVRLNQHDEEDHETRP